MRKTQTLSTKVSDMNYEKIWDFLEEYNKRTEENLTMSELVWKAVKKFATETMKSWKG